MSLTNGSKDGYDKGFEDGKNGKDKNPVPLSSVAKHIFRTENYNSEFIKQYAIGWEAGNAKRKKVGEKS